MRLFFLALMLLFGAQLLAQDEARLLRFPATNDQQLVFSYAGDLYSVSLDGGMARRLTSHDGYEMFARFSPDGKTIAFTGQYDGNTEVFSIPAQGGTPKRLTFTATLGRDDIADRMGPNNIVMDWSSDGSKIAFRSRMRSFNSFNGSLYTVSKEGGMPEQIPVIRGGFLSFSADDSKMAFNRIFREFRTWKRYRGGMADDIWIFDFNSGQTEQITDNEAQDIIPMWIGDNIYFLSDRDENGRMNLYVYNLTSKEERRLTDYKEFDIKFPSAGQKFIVYENGGYIYKFNTETEQAEKVTVQISNDFLAARPELKNVGKEITNYEIAPDGKRALFGARGDVFTVPAEKGITYNITETSGVHERNSKWSPDGKWIAYISDASGEFEIYVQDKDGRNAPRQVTSNGAPYKYQMYWSPDSKKLLWSDRSQTLYYTDIATKKTTQVAKATAWEISEYTWSPDSRFIAYSFPEEEMMQRIYIYSLESKENTPVTDGWYNSGSPAFSNDGTYLLFASSRDFNPIYSWTEWNHAYQDMARVYLLTLNADTPSPFLPENDTVNEEKKEEKTEEDKNLKIDFDNISARIIALPIKSAAYGNISAIDGKVYYIRNSSSDNGPLLMLYDLAEQKETELGKVNGYEISADGKKMLVGMGGSYAIIGLPTGPIKTDDKIDTGNMEAHVDYKAEWKQIFNESWRQMRDFFYVPNMHGVDWPAIRDKYAPLVEYVNHRNDLTYVIGEMVGELNVGHAYVGAGDRLQPKRIQTGLLGAELEKHSSGFYKITRILPGKNWDRSTVSPLTEVGIDVNEGDFIVAIEGESVKDMKTPFAALVGKAGKPLRLTVNSSPQMQGSREILLEPVADESQLYYTDWVQTNIDKVNKATDDKVGYLHIPDMGRGGLNEFVEHYYPQLQKKALIVDVRGNGGGNVSPMIIERLRREAVMINMARNSSPGVNPGGMIFGPMICLADEFSASDGDIFTYRFKKHGLGKVVGKRTWGGVVGIRGSLPFIDGGSLNKPEFSRYDMEGQNWIMEGVGVEPDIYVDNDPHQEFLGNDAQLQRAIKEIMDELKTAEKEIPDLPPAPDKSK